jgi:predicted branched-subunit amino acid permease
MTATTTPTAAPPAPVADALRDVLPLAIGYVPFALVVGTALAEHHGGPAGWAGSWLIYGGSAQLAALRALGSSGAAIAVLTGLLVNARMMLYTAALAHRWRDQPRWFRLLGAALVIDVTFALAAARPLETRARERSYVLVVGLTLGAVWTATIGVGALLGPRLHFAALGVIAPMCLVALIAPRLVQRGERPTIVVAAGVAVLAAGRLPAGTGVPLAVAAGWLAGTLADRTIARSHHQ